MADAKNTEAPKARRKQQGPRQERPTFAVITMRDDSGNTVALDESKLSVRFTKDPTELVQLLTGANKDPNAVVIQATAGGNRQSPAADAASQSGEQTQAG